MAPTRRLAAIMFTDIKDFTKRMGSHESLGLRLLEKHNAIMDRALQKHSGTLVKNIGDSYLVDFASAVNAVEAAMDAQEQFALANAGAGPDEEILVRISIHLGDVVVRDADVFGDGVNIASRLQSITPPGGICISREVYTHVKSKLEMDCVAVGSHHLKGVAEPVDVYQIMTPLVPRAAVKAAAPPAAVHADAAAVPASIAVLPFSNWSEDKENEYFSDGITEDIITDLAKIESLRVCSRNSVFTYKGKAVEIGHVGAELNVRYVLEGSVRRSGSRLRITAQLIDAQSNGHLWAERFDRELSDVFAIQDEIAKRIAAELRLRLTREQEKAIETRGTKSLEAYDLYLKGLYHSRKRTKEDLTKAVEHLDSAIKLDPDFAQAHATLAWTLRFIFGFGMDRAPTVIERARTHADRALALDPRLPDGLLARGLLLREEGRMAEAIATLRTLVEQHPSHSQGHAYLGNACRDVGMVAHAIHHHTKAMELDPRDFIHPYNLCEDLLLNGNGVNDFEPFVQRAAALAPGHFTVLYYRAMVAASRGDESGAERLIDEMMVADPQHHSPDMLRGMYRLWRGRLEEAYADLRLPAEMAWAEPAVALTCIPGLAAMRKFDDALRLIDRTLQQKQTRFVGGVELGCWALVYRGLILKSRGDRAGSQASFAEARDRASTLRSQFPDSLLLRILVAGLDAFCGNRDGALAEMERVRVESPSFLRYAHYRAMISAVVHDKPGLLAWARVVVDQGTVVYQGGLKNDLFFEEYSTDPDFLAIVDRSG